MRGRRTQVDSSPLCILNSEWERDEGKTRKEGRKDTRLKQWADWSSLYHFSCGTVHLLWGQVTLFHFLLRLELIEWAFTCSAFLSLSLRFSPLSLSSLSSSLLISPPLIAFHFIGPSRYVTWQHTGWEQRREREREVKVSNATFSGVKSEQYNCSHALCRTVYEVKWGRVSRARADLTLEMWVILTGRGCVTQLSPSLSLALSLSLFFSQFPWKLQVRLLRLNVHVGSGGVRQKF